MTSPAPLGTRLTLEAVAPVIDGAVRPAPQPLGTWMTRWATLYTDPALPSRPAPELPLPQAVPAAALPRLPHVAAA